MLASSDEIGHDGPYVSEHIMRVDQGHGVKNQKRERRRHRSSDTITALHYQLAAIRREAALEAVVLVDDTGCLVAGAGAWPVCEELAAYAPLLAEDPRTLRTIVSARIAAISAQAERLAFDVDGQEVLLCGRGGTDKRSGALNRAAEGVRRILQVG